MANAVTEFVYFVQAGDGKGDIKIGFTRDVDKRISSLQTGCPLRLRLLGSVATTDARLLEYSLHEKFKHHRIGTSEWFTFHMEIVDEMETLKSRVGKRFDPVTQTVAIDWHRPLCSFCRKAIVEIGHGLAGYYETDNKTHDPFVVHCGRYCGFYDRNEGMLDLPVESFRRAPMEAVMVAMRRNSDDVATRAIWNQWVSVVLGLPFNQWTCTSALKVNGEVAENLAWRVQTLDEAQKTFKKEIENDHRRAAAAAPKMSASEVFTALTEFSALEDR